MKQLGLGIQAFSELKTKNFIYVDKTENICKLINDGKYYFLSRPRRFGKSLLVDTMKELFSGNKSLFEDCWAYDQWNWQKKYPVIKLSFAEISYREQGLEEALNRCLLEQAEQHGIQLRSLSYSERFLELIKKLGQDTPVAVLIDEYDKPIIDYLEKSAIDQALNNREILKTLYAGVKDQDRYLRFFFLTGVSKFSRVSIFSDLNHLTDITMNSKFAALAGYTAVEIQTYYGEFLGPVARKNKLSLQQLLVKIKEWYNGYSWDGETFVSNPYSILNLFYAEVFKNYWFETGTPTFLIKKWKETNYKPDQAINTLVKESAFNTYDVDYINITAILFQTGYLTIKKVDYEQNKYLLEFPNKEVRESFLDFAVEHYADSSSAEVEHIIDSLLEALERNELTSFFTALQSLFSSITVKQLEKVKEYEGFYHSIIYIVLKLLGIRITCEVQSSFGSTDAVIKTAQHIYVVEFKMGTAQSALEQIRKRQYYAPYLADKREVILVGVGIDKAQRNLADFLCERGEDA